MFPYISEVRQNLPGDQDYQNTNISEGCVKVNGLGNSSSFIPKVHAFPIGLGSSMVVVESGGLR